MDWRCLAHLAFSLWPSGSNLQAHWIFGLNTLFDYWVFMTLISFFITLQKQSNTLCSLKSTPPTFLYNKPANSSMVSSTLQDADIITFKWTCWSLLNEAKSLAAWRLFSCAGCSTICRSESICDLMYSTIIYAQRSVAASSCKCFSSHLSPDSSQSKSIAKMNLL